MSEATMKVNPHEIIFSLDIGTRNVVGVIGKKEKDHFTIIDVEIMEHPGRTMYDGQIHDIDKVVEVVKRIKEALEARVGFEIKRAAIAAAGRALKTYRVAVSREIDFSREIDKTLIDSLEMEGIQKAQQQLERESGEQEHAYYCVGYTVVNYSLNDGIITSLKGHRGNKIGAEVLATFLPHVVVNSLYTVMDRTGLEVMNLTLEPIAAIHAAIPPKLRLLNLALVDIGAGTSDIALTQDGTVVAYAMASVAGDEITEILAKTYLLDFDTAEKLKLNLNKKETLTFSDIVGISYDLASQEIVEKIAPVIESLASEIAHKIIEYNGKAPSAVFCIGGGSQIPSFTSYLAEKLGLPKERVVVRGTEIIENILFQCSRLEGPEFITPIGIGIVAAKDREQDFLQVTVNGHSVKLFNSKQLLVSDALILIGYQARKLIARRGQKLTFMLNGKEKSAPGEPGEPARIYLNGKLASLDTKIYGGDVILIEPGVDGKDGSAKLRDMVEHLKVVTFNDLDVTLYGNLLVNETTQNLDYEIQEGDDISFTEIDCVEALLERFEMKSEHYDIHVNGTKVEKAFKLKHGDKIFTHERNKHQEDPVEQASEPLKKISSSSEPSILVYVNGKTVEIKKDSPSFIFVDVFNHIDFDRSKPKGNLILQLNGRRANYVDEIQHGDQIEIYWEDK